MKLYLSIFALSIFFLFNKLSYATELKMPFPEIWNTGTPEKAFQKAEIL